MKQIISIGIGQCGIRLAESTFNTYIQEHALDQPGHGGFRLPTSYFATAQPPHSNLDSATTIPLQHMSPRLIVIDTEQGEIDTFRASPLLGRITPLESYIHSNGSTGNNYAMGFNSFGHQLAGPFRECLRRQAENCDYLTGMHFYHAIGGGTGSGLATKMLYIANQELGMSRLKLSFTVIPSTNSEFHNSDNVIQAYNAVLALGNTQQLTTAKIILSNQSLMMRRNIGRTSSSYSYGRKYDRKYNPKQFICSTYKEVNKEFSATIADISSSERLEVGSMSASKMLTNMCPFPRFNLLSCTRRYYFEEKIFNKRLIIDSFRHVTSIRGEMSGLMRMDKMLGLNCFLRGPVCLENYQRIVAESDKKYRNRYGRHRLPFDFIDWLRNILVHHSPAGAVNPQQASVSAINHNQHIGKTLEYLTETVQKNYRRRAFLWRYTQQGMDESEVGEATDNLYCMVREYGDIGGCDNCCGEQGGASEEEDEEQQQEEEDG